MRSPILFLIFFLIGVLASLVYKTALTRPNQPVTGIIQTITRPTFDIANPPPQSINGEIIQMSGDIFWQGRTATKESELKQKIMIKQGEMIRTGENASLSINFPNLTQIKIYPSSQIEVIQSLRENFVANLTTGQAEFTKTGVSPVSIRALHLLVNQNSGKLTITITESKISLNITEGAVTLAYNDTFLKSHVLTLNSPNKISFNDKSRLFE
jgi:hypothetical protein